MNKEDIKECLKIYENWKHGSYDRQCVLVNIVYDNTGCGNCVFRTYRDGPISRCERCLRNIVIK